MSRPATLKVGNTSYWTIMTYTSAGVLVDADSTPTVVVYKNGSVTADVVTVTKRSATTGIYDAYYNPAGEAEGDCFTIQETATISSQSYVQSWNFEVLAAERGTDNASTFDASSDAVTTDAASRTASQADVSALATSASIAALNDLSSVDVENAVWDASLSSHNTGGSTGKALKNLKEGIVSYEGQVNDASATTTSFITNLASSIDDFYNSQTIHFISGILQGQSRLVLDYDGTTKQLTVEEALSSAPANGTEFIILSTHVHTMAEIVNGVWSESDSSYTVAGTFGYNIDAIKDKTDQLTFTIPNKVDSSATVVGGDATAANQTTIIGMLSGASVVVSQSDLKVGDSVTLRQGMDYNNLDGTAISWTGSISDQWPDLTGSTVTFTAVQGSKIITKTIVVTSPTGTQAFYVEFTAAELSATNAPTGNYRYYITALLSNGRKTTLITDSTLRVAEPYSSGE